MGNNNMDIANAIYSHLGGNRFSVMTGANNLMADVSSFSFSLPNNLSDKKINFVKISLNSMDLYDIEFGRNCWKKDKVLGVSLPSYEKIEEVSGIYAEDLQRIFTDVTGLATFL